MFPSDLVTLAKPTSTQNRVGHADLHTQVSLVLEAIQAKVGINNSTEPTSFDYRINSLEDSVVHKTGDETIGGVKTFQGNSSSNHGIRLQNLGTGGSQISWRKPNGNEKYALTYIQSDESLRFYNGSTDIFNLQGGNVGVGTTSPSEKLDVNGNAKISGTLELNEYLILKQDTGWWGGRIQHLNNSNVGFIVGTRTAQGNALVWEATDGTNYWDRMSLGIDGSLTVNNQNWTSAWTSYTPTLSGSDGGSGATATISNAKYKVLGKSLFFQISMVLTSKGTCTGGVRISQPSLGQNTAYQVVTGGVYPTNSSTSRGFMVAVSNHFTSIKASGVSSVVWADMAVNDEILISGVIEI